MYIYSGYGIEYVTPPIYINGCTVILTVISEQPMKCYLNGIGGGRWGLEGLERLESPHLIFRKV